ncbi:MAG: hypothetical protein KIC96_15865 [Enterococcus casseliflavus]|uniref:hypothetical protein n=1 Tax=Enterococcus casseliflavus TaxID=37734 RepID=UPI000E539087|nr:hypothetical protein [Enterococcus casseliflavus]MBS5816150.1 hypothetical protein [Enterococcus casseliflavus]MDU3348821.1 hypothetical protein [Clostridium sp.]RHH55524.1 hypothetical protein DW201_09275 [Enterococcus casseliflavus]
MVAVGQGVLGKITFLNGSEPKGNRPYLVVETTSEGCYVLDVSSSKGKERKLLMDSNHSLEQYDPPFILDSFVKLDSKKFVSNLEISKLRVLKGGSILNQKDLKTILDACC